MQVLLAVALSLVCLCALAQEPGKPSAGPLAEFNTALAVVMKTPVVINPKGKKTESFCKRPDGLSDAEIRKLELSCEKIFNDATMPEIQRVAAKYVLGKTKAQYQTRDYATRFCDEAQLLLSAVSDFYDQKNISGSGPHEALASCLISTERYEAALAWTERGIKRKETAQMQFLVGVARQNMNESVLAKNAFERALVLDPNHEASKKSLSEIEALIEQHGQAASRSEDASTVNSGECQAWKNAIVSNRKVCDAFLEKSFDEFFSCMDEGMAADGFAPRSDERTQALYRTCGLSSWTDESLKPEEATEQ